MKKTLITTVQNFVDEYQQQKHICSSWGTPLVGFAAGFIYGLLAGEPPAEAVGREGFEHEPWALDPAVAARLPGARQELDDREPAQRRLLGGLLAGSVDGSSTITFVGLAIAGVGAYYFFKKNHKKKNLHGKSGK